MTLMDRNKLLEIGKRKLKEYQARQQNNPLGQPQESFSPNSLENTSVHQLLDLLHEMTKEKASMESELVMAQNSLQDYQQSYMDMKRDMEVAISTGKHTISNLEMQLETALIKNEQLVQDALAREQQCKQLELEKNILQVHLNSLQSTDPLVSIQQQQQLKTTTVNLEWETSDKSNQELMRIQELYNKEKEKCLVLQSQLDLGSIENQKLQFQIEQLSKQVSSKETIQNVPLAKESDQKSQSCQTDEWNSKDFDAFMSKKEAMIANLQKELMETHQNATNQVVLLGNANAHLKKELEAEKKLVDLLSAEVDTLPDYIQLFHSERKKMQEKYTQLLNQLSTPMSDTIPLGEMTKSPANITSETLIESPLQEDESRMSPDDSLFKSDGHPSPLLQDPIDESQDPMDELQESNNCRKSTLETSSLDTRKSSQDAESRERIPTMPVVHPIPPICFHCQYYQDQRI